MKFVQRLAERRPLLLDGAMGTMLQASGLPAGVSPEEFCMERPDILQAIHKAYLDAGVDIITSCTFGGNPCKLPASLDVFAFNKRMVETARAAAAQAGRPVFVAGNVGPSGHFARPWAIWSLEDLIRAFAEQIRGLVAGGADLIFIETQFDLAEARAAVAAARQVCDLPVMVSMTFEQGVSLTGSSPTIFAETMQNMGVAALGTNCSLGPDQMLPVVEELLSACSCPVVAEPNAGLPELRGSETVFPLGPEAFAQKTAAFAARGAWVLGGCCGTTPRHLAALRQALESVSCEERPLVSPAGICLTSRSQLLRLGEGQPFSVIGERINPTGKKELTRQLQAGQFDEAFRLADEQLQAGARILDVNVGASLVDETVLLPDLVQRLVSRVDVPLSLDSSSAQAIARALPYCPGSFLVNSISGEAGRMELLGPVCRDFGAPFILLPLQGTKLPVRASERIAIVEKLLEQADALGIPRRLVMVDILALSVSSKPEGALQCLEMVRWCRSQGLATTLGLSNVSCSACRPATCSMPPSWPCARAPGSRPASPILPRHACMRPGMPWPCLGGATATPVRSSPPMPTGKPAAVWSGQEGAGRRCRDVGDAVLSGTWRTCCPCWKKSWPPVPSLSPWCRTSRSRPSPKWAHAMSAGSTSCPSLIRAAETMQRPLPTLRPLLEKSRGPEERPAIVMATVEGDIHDIGKNIVCLLLGNHGFEVIDAGKDVPAEQIVACALEHKARIIGLSALMTTTMVRMEDTIRLVRERSPIKVLVGGAAVTQAFADAIGADAYCEDAVSAVRAAKQFVTG